MATKVAATANPGAPLAAVPFCLPQQVVRDGVRMGLGILRTVTAAANTDVTLVHNLGNVPHFVVPLDNGTAFVPRVKRSTVTAWTVTTATVQFDTATSGAFIWIV